MKSLLQAFELMADMAPEAPDSSVVSVSRQPSVKVTLYRRVNGRMDAWSDVQLEVNHECDPEPVELQARSRQSFFVHFE